MRVARLVLSLPMLEQALGIEGQGLHLCYAAIDCTYFKNHRLVLLVEGDGLPEEFSVTDGQEIQSGEMVIRNRGTGRETTIRSVPR
jgi:hypothetical protein